MTQENNHIVKSYDAELADLKNRTINMGEALRRQVNAVGDALLTIDEEAARRVVERDAVLNSWEVELDAYVQFLLSRRQPLASDLRFLMGVLRISVDLERAGDEVESAYLAGEDHIPKDIEFHTCIAHCSRNRVMEMLVPIINTAVMTFANLTYRTLKEETIQTHRAVTEAILSGDSVGARCAMVMHLTYNRQALLRQRKLHQKDDSADTSDESAV